MPFILYFLQDIFQEPCQMYFTLQPPVDVPCNPYVFKNTALSLQCMVSAPALNAYLQELNFTIEWLRTSENPGDIERIIYTSHPDDSTFKVITEHSNHISGESEIATSVFVKSTLSFDMNQASHLDLSGHYWCRVVAKDLENYSYRTAGDSGTATLLKSKSYYFENRSFYPPCVGETSLHHAELKCVEDLPLSPLKYFPPLITANTYNTKYQADVINVVVSIKALTVLTIAVGIMIILALFIILFHRSKKQHMSHKTSILM